MKYFALSTFIALLATIGIFIVSNLGNTTDFYIVRNFTETTIALPFLIFTGLGTLLGISFVWMIRAMITSARKAVSDQDLAQALVNDATKSETDIDETPLEQVQ